MTNDDLARLRLEYADREQRLAGSDIYSLFNPATLFIWQGRQRAVLSALRRHDCEALSDHRILELGCGRGGVLLEYLNYGAIPGRLHGTDLLPDRVIDARRALPQVAVTNADGQHLPYVANQFDIVLQYTVFSSILDDSVKQRLAQEMLRVLRKPRGLILWYDFWLNPTNRQTRGIRPAEIRRLFPNCRCEFQRITLAPPITRRLIKASWLACYLLEKVRAFNSHYLAAIRPVSPAGEKDHARQFSV
jgi:ubiquinone/menaquinone biosynthesis C-methylase UbiE